MAVALLAEPGIGIGRSGPFCGLSVGGGSLDDRVVLADDEDLLQELLTVAAAELVVVGTERLVEEAAKSTEHARGDGILFDNLARRRANPRWRDQPTAVDIVVERGHQLIRLEPGLVLQHRKQGPRDLHDTGVKDIVVEREVRRLGKGIDHDDGAGGLVPFPLIGFGIVEHDGAPRIFEWLVVDEPAIDTHEPERPIGLPVLGPGWFEFPAGCERSRPGTVLIKGDRAPDRLRRQANGKCRGRKRGLTIGQPLLTHLPIDAGRAIDLEKLPRVGRQPHVLAPVRADALDDVVRAVAHGSSWYG